MIFRGESADAAHNEAESLNRFSLEKCLAQCLVEVSKSCLVLPVVARGSVALSKSRKLLTKKPPEVIPGVSNWVKGLDLNQRPSGYEPDELPGCSTLQQMKVHSPGRGRLCQMLFTKRPQTKDLGSKLPRAQ